MCDSCAANSEHTRQERRSARSVLQRGKTPALKRTHMQMQSHKLTQHSHKQDLHKPKQSKANPKPHKAKANANTRSTHAHTQTQTQNGRSMRHARRKRESSTGLEPAISRFVGGCLIHWATRTSHTTHTTHTYTRKHINTPITHTQYKHKRKHTQTQTQTHTNTNNTQRTNTHYATQHTTQTYKETPIKRQNDTALTQHTPWHDTAMVQWNNETMIQ